MGWGDLTSRLASWNLSSEGRVAASCCTLVTHCGQQVVGLMRRFQSGEAKPISVLEALSTMRYKPGISFDVKLDS